MEMEPGEESEERFSTPGDFEENLSAVLGVDPEAMDDDEEPSQE